MVVKSFKTLSYSAKTIKRTAQKIGLLSNKLVVCLSILYTFTLPYFLELRSLIVVANLNAPLRITHLALLANIRVV
jgi:hypothetical protein